MSVENLPDRIHGQFGPGNPWAFKPGGPPGPGRPKGLRDKLQGAFLDALAADFQKYGHVAIQTMRRRKPADYVKCVASLMPKQIEVNNEPFDGVGDDELAAILVYARDALATARLRREGAAAEDGHQQAERLPALPKTG